MSTIPKGKYPGFDELQRFIFKHIDKSCINKEIFNNQIDAKEQLKETKVEYYQYSYLYTILKDILLENNFGIPDPLFEVENRENIYKVVLDLLSTVEAKHCLKISGRPNAPPSEANLFGLTLDDFEMNGSTKKSLHQTIQQLLIPQIEKQMKCLSLDLFRFLNPGNEDSEGLALAKANKMLLFITNEKQKILDGKKTIADEKARYNEVYQDYIMKISKKLDDLEDEYMDSNKLQNAETNKINVDWLAAKCDFMLGKVEVMNNRLYFDTYTKDKVEALKKIHIELSKQIGKTEEEIQKTQRSLKIYESIDDSFTQLLNEYTQLNIDIENKKWALAELKSSKIS